MANFSYIPGRGSLAAWNTGGTVNASDFWFFESSIVKCPNFADGCAFSPTSAINIGGTYGIVLASGTPLTVGGILTTQGWANLSRSVSIGTDDGDAFEVIATETHYSDESHSGNVTFAAGKSVTFNNGAIANARVYLYDGANIGSTTSSTSSFTGSLSASNGYIGSGVQVLGDNTYTVAVTGGAIVTMGNITEDRIIYVTNTGLVGNPIMFVTFTGSSFGVAVRNSSDSSLVASLSTSFRYVAIYHNGTKWTLLFPFA